MCGWFLSKTNTPTYTSTVTNSNNMQWPALHCPLTQHPVLVTACLSLMLWTRPQLWRLLFNYLPWHLYALEYPQKYNSIGDNHTPSKMPSDATKMFKTIRHSKNMDSEKGKPFSVTASWRFHSKEPPWRFWFRTIRGDKLWLDDRALSTQATWAEIWHRRQKVLTKMMMLQNIFSKNSSKNISSRYKMPSLSVYL